MPFSSLPEELLRDPVARFHALNEIGSAIEIDNNIPPRRYFRSGMEMMRMANVYFEEGNLENAFILYSKFITLFVEKLPSHEDYKSAANVDKINMKKKIKEVFPKAEKIKEILMEKYSQETAQWEKENKQRQAILAKERELKTKEAEEKLRRETERRKFEQEKQERLLREKERQRHFAQTNPYDSSYSGILENSLDWPDLPEWEDSGTSSTNSRLTSPSILSSVEIEDSPLPDIALSVTPKIDRSTKPSSLLSPGTGSHAKQGLRDIIVPHVLLTRFLNLAEVNTEKGIETCGVLAGQMSHNRFTVTHLLVPKQKGTSDSCLTENEEDIFEYQDQHDLLTLGWIHTHPTQTSFMSSVDLHTHCAYQLLMPEAVAIVCAPKFQETGIFSLTQDYGLEYIANCHQSGFHPHPKEPALYETSNHVIMDSSAKVTVVDLRCV